MPKIDPVAAGGFASAASTYARIRPRYARAAIGAIKDLSGHSRERPAHALDVAAGTGILTGQLARAGLAVAAVEPVDEMARQLRLSLPHVPVALGTAEDLPVRGAAFDVYVVGTAFHWFEPGAALDEARRVLRPGGAVALLWNLRDTSVPWVDDLTRFLEAHTAGRPYSDHRERPWTDVFEAHGGFTPLVEQRTPNPVPTTVAGVLDRARSTSFVGALDEGRREEVIAEAATLLDGHGLSGTFEYPYETVLLTCRVLD